MTSLFLYFTFSTLYSCSLCRTDTVVFTKLNKLPFSNNLSPSLLKPPQIVWNKKAPRGGILRDLRYWSWQHSLHKQGYSLISIGSDAWRRNNGQRSFAYARLTQCSKAVENRLKSVFKFISPGFWTDLNSCRQWLPFVRHLISRKSSLCSQCIRNVTGTTQATNE